MGKKVDRTEFIIKSKTGQMFLLIYQNQGNWERSYECVSFNLDHSKFLNDYVQMEFNIDNFPKSSNGKIIALRRSIASEDKYGIWSTERGRTIGDFDSLVKNIDEIYRV